MELVYTCIKFEVLLRGSEFMYNLLRCFFHRQIAPSECTYLYSVATWCRT